MTGGYVSKGECLLNVTGELAVLFVDVEVGCDACCRSLFLSMLSNVQPENSASGIVHISDDAHDTITLGKLQLENDNCVVQSHSMFITGRTYVIQGNLPFRVKRPSA